MPSILQLYKNAYNGLARETWFLSLVILINRSGTMVVPFMTMYTTERLGFSVTQAGIVMAAFGAGSIVGAFVGGKVTDAVGFYVVQMFALAAGGLMFIVLSYLTNFVALCIGTFSLSMVNEAFRPANSTAIAHYSTVANRTRSYSLNRLAVNLGWAFGGAIGGLLASIDYHLLFWVDGFTNISAAIFMFFVLPKPKNMKQLIAQNKQNSGAGRSPYADKNYLFFIFLTILFAFAFFQMFTILPVYLKQQLFISERSIGLLMAVNGVLIALLEMVIVFNLEQRPRPLKYISYGVWLVGISYAVYNVLSGNFWLALLSTVIITVGEMLSMPFMNSYWISRSSENNRGQYAALYTMAWGTAQIAAPSFGGWIADNYSYDLLWWIVFGVTIMAGIGFKRLR